MYTDSRTLGPNMKFASIKVRKAIGRDAVYGLFNVIILFNTTLNRSPILIRRIFL